MMRHSVAITHGAGYAETPPWHPDEAFPEHAGRPVGSEANPAYRAVRASLCDLGLDRANQGRPGWNPLGGIVRPGDRVFVKPNWVTHEVRRSCRTLSDLYAIVTHPAILRAVADYVGIALAGEGEIVIGDNPSIDCDFDALMQKTRMRELPGAIRELFGVPCRVVDLRPLVCADLADYGIESRMRPGPGDPLGYREIDLGRDSFFADVPPWLLRGVFTRRGTTIHAHRAGRHRYALSGTMLDADVFISVPKLKTHHKVGATLNVKGLVGTVHTKNHLAHWRIGYPLVGGDEFPDLGLRDSLLVAARHLLTEILPEPAFAALKRRLAGGPLSMLLHETRLFSGNFARGAWPGNDTAWRMAADLYEAFVRRRAGRRFFSVVDGVRAGEGDGPFCPSPKNAGVVLAGEDLLAVDATAVRLMGFNADLVRYLPALLARSGVGTADIDVVIDGAPAPDFFERGPSLDFLPPTAWPGLALRVRSAA